MRLQCYLRPLQIVMLLVSVSVSPISARASAGHGAATQTRLLVERFVAAYNREDFATVRVLTASNILWADCDYLHHDAVRLKGKRAVLRWFRRQFALHDRLQVTKILAGGTINDSYSPLPFGLLGTRSNDALRAQRYPPQSFAGSKGAVDPTQTRVRFYLMISYARCVRPDR